MKALFIRCTKFFAVSCLLAQRTLGAFPGVELDSDLFEQLIADKHEQHVKDSQIWFVFFNSPHGCRPRQLCADLNEVWGELATHVARSNLNPDLT